MARREVEVDALVAAARDGSAPAVARLVSLVEDGHPALPAVMAALAPHTGRAHHIGLTGPPGVGKSTTASAVVRALRGQGQVVGVLAVDPTSPFSGGALLGDRIRMQEHALDRGVYLRSLASRGHLGGLTRSTAQAARIMDAAGCDVVLIETVGVGQSEVEVAGLADTTVVLLAPGMGDGVQAAKAGILEVADVLAVNKADRDGADTAVRDLRHMVQMGAASAPGSWSRRVVRLAAQSGEGVDDLLEAIAEHREWLDSSGALQRRRIARAAREIESIALARVRDTMSGVDQGGHLEGLAAAVMDGTLDPYAAAGRLLAALR